MNEQEKLQAIQKRDKSYGRSDRESLSSLQKMQTRTFLRHHREEL